MQTSALFSFPLAALALGCAGELYQAAPVVGPISGVVVDMDGEPLSGAEVSTLADGSWGAAVRSDGWGEFETTESEGNRFVRVEADGYLSRVRPGSPSEQLVVRLSEDDGATARLRFGGNTMFGRRYYDPDEDGYQDDALIRTGLELLDVQRMLAGVEPLLRDADLAAVNLESPVTLGGGEHADKTDSFHSRPGALTALRAVGVDLLGLANDHVYDHLDSGLTDTLALAGEVDLATLGAGRDESEAWEPLVLDVGPVRVGFVACTTVAGGDQQLSTVADDDAGKGGAARCDEDWLQQAITSADEQADVVVFQLHGGFEFEAEPSEAAVSWTELAMLHGATVAVNHHPQLVGGMGAVDGHLAAWSLGNLAFDREHWLAYPSAVLELQLGRDGSLRRAYLEPLLLDDYQPRAVLGWPQQRIARDMLGLSDASVAIDDGALELDLEGRGALQESVFEAHSEGDGWSSPIDLRQGWVAEVNGADAYRLGRDLLLVGDFEDDDVDTDVAEGALWDLDSSYERVSELAAWEGYYGLRLSRDFTAEGAVWCSPSNRMPLDGASRVTVAGQARATGTLELQVSWYSSADGSSSEREYHLLETAEDWGHFELDLLAPDDAVAVNIFFKLHPPARDQVDADLDALRVIAWSDELPEDKVGYDALQVQGAAVVSVNRRVMPVTSH